MKIQVRNVGADRRFKIAGRTVLLGGQQVIEVEQADYDALTAADKVYLQMVNADPAAALSKGVPVFVQADQPVNAPVPSVWIPLSDNAPVPPHQWQVLC